MLSVTSAAGSTHDLITGTGVGVHLNELTMIIAPDRHGIRCRWGRSHLANRHMPRHRSKHHPVRKVESGRRRC